MAKRQSRATLTYLNEFTEALCNSLGLIQFANLHCGELALLYMCVATCETPWLVPW